MNQYIIILANLIFLLPIFAQVTEISSFSTKVETQAAVAPLAVGLPNMHTGADTAYLSSVINPNSMKGVLGESLAEECYLNRSRSGAQWQRLSPRCGPQGIDHIFIKTDSAGHPRDLFIAESKYGSSTLGVTQDGIQMSKRWQARRLQKMGERYLSAANAAQVGHGVLPLFATQSLSLRLRNGSESHFWRVGAKDTWKFTGTAQQLAEAQKIVGEYGRFLRSAGLGRIRTRQRIFHCYPRGDDLVIDMHKLQNSPLRRSLTDLPIEDSIVLKDALITKGYFPAVAKREYACAIQRRTGMSDAKSRLWAEKILANLTPKEMFKTVSATPHAVRHPVRTRKVGGVRDFGFQAYSREWLATRNTFAHGGSGLSALVDHRATAAFAPSSHAWSTMKLGRIRPKILFRGGGLVGGALAAYNYHQCLSGEFSLREANRNAIVNAGSAGAACAAEAAAMAMVSTYATASTGTAITTLSGAAATNATLAWFGGGSIAAGGSGVAGGAVVLFGAGTLVAAVAAVAIYKAFEYHDQCEERARVNQHLDYYADENNWIRVLCR